MFNIQHVLIKEISSVNYVGVKEFILQQTVLECICIHSVLHIININHRISTYSKAQISKNGYAATKLMTNCFKMYC